MPLCYKFFQPPFSPAILAASLRVFSCFRTALFESLCNSQHTPQSTDTFLMLFSFSLSFLLTSFSFPLRSFHWRSFSLNIYLHQEEPLHFHPTIRRPIPYCETDYEPFFRNPPLFFFFNFFRPNTFSLLPDARFFSYFP